MNLFFKKNHNIFKIYSIYQGVIYISNVKNKFFQNIQGSVAIIFAISLIPILAAVSVSIDYTRASDLKSKLDAASDSAALSATQMALADANAPDYSKEVAAAKSIFYASMSSNKNATISQVNVSVASGNGGKGSVETTVSYTASLNTIMGDLFMPTMTVTGGAVAAASKGTSASCITVLDKTGPQALLINSSVNIIAPDCQIDVHAAGPTAAIFNASISVNVSKICVAGTDVIQNGGSSVPRLSLGCAVPADPYAGKLPVVSNGACTVNGQNYAGVNTLSPGTYCGNFNFNGNGTLNLLPGLYVLSGTRWNLNSGWNISGVGVTFYFEDENSYVQINSGANISISAPTSGVYSGILMFEPMNLPNSQFSINGSAGHALTGLIYLPSRDVTFNSMSTVTSENIMMVFYRLILNPMNWAIAPNGGTSTVASAPRLIK